MIYRDLPNKLSGKGKNNIEAKGEYAVANSLNNIISTSRGTVPGHPDFGCSIDQFIFETINPLTVASIEAEIRYALGKWEPRIIVMDVDITEDGDYNRIVIKIKYRIKTEVDSLEYEYIYKQELV